MSLFTEIINMQQKLQLPEALKAFIVKWGLPDVLLSDNTQVEILAAVQAILQAYNICQETTEPHHPNQNPAEWHIQVCKNMTNIILDRTRSPSELWLLCLYYVYYPVNRLTHCKLNWRTPIEVAVGVTPEISALMCFHW